MKAQTRPGLSNRIALGLVVALVAAASTVFVIAAKPIARPITPAKPTTQRIRWEYKQLATTASFSEWDEYGDQGWEFVGILDKAVIFKREKL